jgi:hypothetical protein
MIQVGPRKKANGFEKRKAKMGFMDYMQIGFFAALIIAFVYGFYYGYK